MQAIWKRVALQSRKTSKTTSNAFVRPSWPRLASTSPSQNDPSVPPREQPTTSPDRKTAPLSCDIPIRVSLQDVTDADLSLSHVCHRKPAGSEGTDRVTRNAATISEEQDEPKDDGQGSKTEQENEIAAKLNKHFPGGTIAVQDVSGELYFLAACQEVTGLRSLACHRRLWHLLCHFNRKRCICRIEQN